MKVSIVMPIYNEEKYIDKCICSLLKQDFSRDEMEWLFVDGMSSDNTVKIIKKYQTKYPDLIYVFENPEKIVPCAMNIGIKQSCGEYIIRLDAHAEYANNYISNCVRYLETIEADNVGGVAETKAITRQGKTIAKMLSSKFGVGDSKFRTHAKSGYVDTVPFGAFRRDVFLKYGGYDERLVRNQDNEMNYRIRKNGGKIYLAEDIQLSYYCRDSVSGISKMARTNGKWNVITMKLCPGSMGVRHFIPMVFVLSLLLLSVFGFVWRPFWILLAIDAFSYFFLDLLFSAKAKESVDELLFLFVLFPIFHVSYGFGSLIGIFNLWKYKKNGYTPEKI